MSLGTDSRTRKQMNKMKGSGCVSFPFVILAGREDYLADWSVWHDSWLFDIAFQDGREQSFVIWINIIAAQTVDTVLNYYLGCN